MPWVSNQPQKHFQGPDMKDRLICGFSYLSMGMVGLIAYLLQQGKNQSRFFMFHFYQSIMCGIFYMLVGYGFDALMGVFAGLLGGVAGVSGVLGMVSVGFGFVKWALLLVFAYGAVFSFIGKQAEIPGISKVVNQQLR